jgi:hypothetical protein
MRDHSVSQNNPFRQTLLGLEYTTSPGRPADLFSQACVEQFQELGLDRFGYLFAQVFEPNVLREIALLADVPYTSLADLTHSPTPAVHRLAELVDHAGELTVVGLVNVAAALISISRFDLADRMLASAFSRVGDPLEAFEAAMLRFVIANRRDEGSGSAEAFGRMRTAIGTGRVPGDRVMDACAQAVVWYLKRKELPAAEYEWFLARGTALAARPERLDPGSISSWYRALAMVPAAEGEVAQTRQYMEYAQDAAQDSFTRRPRAYELHFMKTYHESSLKEHMYLTRDPDRAEESGRALIALDPAWAPSYGELAEAYLRFGRVQSATELYERAVELGPPHVGHHLLQAARCQEKAGDHERAVEHYLTLSHLVPDDEGVLRAGREASLRVSAAPAAHFEDALERLAVGDPAAASPVR